MVCVVKVQLTKQGQLLASMNSEITEALSMDMGFKGDIDFIILWSAKGLLYHCSQVTLRDAGPALLGQVLNQGGFFKNCIEQVWLTSGFN